MYTEADVDAFARLCFGGNATQDRLYASLADSVERFRELNATERANFRARLGSYSRLYSFLAQVLTFADPDLEKLHVFARHLRQLLPADRSDLPREVQKNIDMESYRIEKTGDGDLTLPRGPGVLTPREAGPQHYGGDDAEIDVLSRIITELKPPGRTRTDRTGRIQDRKDDRRVTLAVLKTIAALLNTEGGDLLIGVADDGSVAGIERDRPRRLLRVLRAQRAYDREAACGERSGMHPDALPGFSRCVGGVIARVGGRGAPPLSVLVRINPRAASSAAAFGRQTLTPTAND